MFQSSQEKSLAVCKGHSSSRAYTCKVFKQLWLSNVCFAFAAPLNINHFPSGNLLIAKTVIKSSSHLRIFLQFIEEQMIPLIYLISSDLCEKARTGLFYFLFSDLRCKDIWVLLEISIIVILLFSSRCCPLSLAWWKTTALMLSAWILLFMWI